jgi:serine/threonine protein kinase
VQDPSGTKIYERIRDLGSDGPFQVEVAWPTERKNVQQTVLLKRLQPGWQVHPSNVGAFVADTLAISLVYHKNVLRIIDAGTEAGRLYVVTEYTHGVSLSSILRHLEHIKVTLDPAFVVKLMRGICQGLGRVSQTTSTKPDEEYSLPKLVHGAFGSDRVLVSFDGAIKVQDFGIYRLYKARSEVADNIAEGLNLSPEQKAGLEPDTRSDMYALGLLFRQLLAKTTKQNDSDQINGLLEICKRLLKRNPEERYSDGRQVLEDLDRHNLAFADAAKLGKFVRGLFEPAKQDSGAVAAEQPPGKSSEQAGQDISWLDPAVFWGATKKTGEIQAVGAQQSIQSEEGDTSEPALDENQDDVAQVVSMPRQAPSSVAPPEDSQPSQPPPEETPASEASPKELKIPGIHAPLEEKQEEKPVAEFVQSTAPQWPTKPRVKLSRPIKTRSKKQGSGGLVLVYAFLATVLVAGLVILIYAGLDKPEDQPIDKTVEGDSGQAHLADPIDNKTHDSTKPETDGGSIDLAGLKVGTLNLTSDPSGVAIFIDGEKRGATPTVLKDLSLNEKHTIKFDLDGFRPWTQEIELTADSPEREIHAGLVKMIDCEKGSGWIYVSTKPASATVELDGKRLPGKTPMVIDDVCAAIYYKLRIRAQGYQTWWQDIKLSPGQVLNLKVDLKQ